MDKIASLASVCGRLCALLARVHGVGSDEASPVFVEAQRMKEVGPNRRPCLNPFGLQIALGIFEDKPRKRRTFYRKERNERIERTL